MAEGVVDQNVEGSILSILPEIKIDRKELYHGSRNPDVTNFNPAEETTIGEGVYLTSDKKAAVGYARRRSRTNEKFTPTLYTVDVKDLRMTDLRIAEGIKLFAELLKQGLLEERRKPNLKWYDESTIEKTLEMIQNNSYRGLKDITWNHQELVTQVLKDQGFDGLIAIEGGEGDEIQEHDSYVVFDPSRVEIKTKERIV